MPVEIPYIPPSQTEGPAIEPVAISGPRPISVGKIAAGVFLGNLITGIVGAILYALFVTH